MGDFRSIINKPFYFDTTFIENTFKKKNFYRKKKKLSKHFFSLQI